MELYNREQFFENYRISFGKLTPQQVNGLEFLLGKLESSKRIDTHPKRAYVLATIQWETAYTFQPITEYGSDKYLKSKKYYPYIGRGYIQLTWKQNYQKFGDALGINLVDKPELANEPEIAWKILEMGMTDNFGVQDPDFTIWTLEDFFSDEKEDFLDARKIINPKDIKSYRPIKNNAIKFKYCLEGSIITEADIPNIRGLNAG